MGSKKSTPWYSSGLRFECTQCGFCCSGEPGYVWVEPDEVQAMADEMEMTVKDFTAEFVRDVGSKQSLREYPDGDCILLDPEKRTCMVYESRPVQCRTWPFWDSNLETKKAWRETCEACPGAGKGPVYSLDEIEVQRKQRSV